MMDNAAQCTCYEGTVKCMESDDARFKFFQYHTSQYMAAGLQGLNAGSQSQNNILDLLMCSKTLLFHCKNSFVVLTKNFVCK